MRCRLCCRLSVCRCPWTKWTRDSWGGIPIPPSSTTTRRRSTSSSCRCSWKSRAKGFRKGRQSRRKLPVLSSSILPLEPTLSLFRVESSLPERRLTDCRRRRWCRLRLREGIGAGFWRNRALLIFFMKNWATAWEMGLLSGLFFIQKFGLTVLWVFQQKKLNFSETFWKFTWQECNNFEDYICNDFVFRFLLLISGLCRHHLAHDLAHDRFHLAQLREKVVKHGHGAESKGRCWNWQTFGIYLTSLDLTMLATDTPQSTSEISVGVGRFYGSIFVMGKKII